MRRISAATGVVAAESSGTNALAPAYEGHNGPLPGIALRTTAPAAAAPTARPTPSAIRRSSRSAADHIGTAPAMSPSANAWTRRPTALEPSRTASWSCSGCDVDSEASNAGKLLISETADRIRDAGGDRQEERHRESTPAPGNDGGNHPGDHHHDRDQHAGSLRDGRDRLRVSLGAFPVLGNEHEPPQTRDLVAQEAARQSKLAPRQRAGTVGKRDQPIGALRQLRRHRGYFFERCGVDAETGPRWRGAPAAGPPSRPATDRCATRAARGSCR